MKNKKYKYEEIPDQELKEQVYQAYQFYFACNLKVSDPIREAQNCLNNKKATILRGWEDRAKEKINNGESRKERLERRYNKYSYLRTWYEGRKNLTED